MISAVNLQPFIGGESQIATMQTFVLIIMSYPSYRRHACLYLFTEGRVLRCRLIVYIFASPGSFRGTCPSNSLLRRGFKDFLVSSNANALDDKHFSSNAGDPMRGPGDNEIPHK